MAREKVFGTMQSLFVCCATMFVLAAALHLTGCSAWMLHATTSGTSLRRSSPIVPSNAPILSLPSRGIFDTRLYSSGDDNATPSTYTDDEVNEMRELILSLSLEKTDHDRRSRVKEVFVKALAKPNGMPERFSALFDRTLTEVGDEVQMEAKKKFFREQQQENEDEEEEDTVAIPPDASYEDDAELAVEDGELRLKSPEELQLWALVDMMVQSKTIVKKRNGSLGSKGTFQ